MPGCVSIKLCAGDDFIRTKDLTAIKLDQLRDEAVNAVGMMIPDPDGGHDAPVKIVRKALRQATTRRKINTDFLRRIAETYKNAPAGDRAEPIRATFGVSTRQAWRCIAQAREKGLLDGND